MTQQEDSVWLPLAKPITFTGRELSALQGCIGSSIHFARNQKDEAGEKILQAIYSKIFETFRAWWDDAESKDRVAQLLLKCNELIERGPKEDAQPVAETIGEPAKEDVPKAWSMVGKYDVAVAVGPRSKAKRKAKHK